MTGDTSKVAPTYRYMTAADRLPSIESQIRSTPGQIEETL